MKSLQVRKELESDVAAQRNLTLAKMPADKEFVQF